MGNFRKFDKSRGGGGYNRGGSDRGRSSSERKQLFPATCSDCGKDCEIPFRPTGKHPVYCSNCFKNQGGGQSRSSGKSFGGDRDRDSFSNRSDRSPKTSGGNTITKAQFDSMTSKLDKIITLLTMAKKEEVEEKKTKKTEAKKIKEVEKKATKKATKKVEKKAVKKLAKKTAKKAKTTVKKKSARGGSASGGKAKKK